MYLQGSKDELIYISNADFARKELINAPHLDIQMLKDEPHFVSYNKRPMVKQKIFELYNMLQNKDLNSTFSLTPNFTAS